ncbi:MAG TPA: beta-galactosidase [Opitutaceae bacterium]
MAVASLAFLASAGAEPLSINIPASPGSAHGTEFHLGSDRSPDGTTIEADQDSLLLNGQPWMPAMGELHYSRVPETQWREELLKMKAGGIQIVSTYVFWNHHEEVENQWDWTGRRNLHEFLRTAGEVGLKVIVRCGPFCHGEVRNGGVPDWAVARGHLRTLDPEFRAEVRPLYAQIAGQLHGLLWKDGGPVIGIQVDNEFSGPAEYLLALKSLAREVGLDVPIYTRTGWPALSTPMPPGQILPLYGVYSEGFWDRRLTSMPNDYWTGFRFSTLRMDFNISAEQRGDRHVTDPADVGLSPYLTCEIGGGMMTSYHRRILIDPRDVEACVLVKLGSGSTLPGYYMYHGGTNPDGRHTTLMEAQSTAFTNYNDLPVKAYDFQAPIGDAGQLRPTYHWLRRLHLFLADFGEGLARMPAFMPNQRPIDEDDVSTLRWSVRSDGSAGYVFVNNYERPTGLSEHPAVQFAVVSPAGALTFPQTPVTVRANAIFLWPFHLDLGHGVVLDDATAQPICRIDDGGLRTVFFAAEGTSAEFAIKGETAPRRTQAGRGAAFDLPGTDGGRVRIVLLSEPDSLRLWKANWKGRDRVFLTSAGLTIDQDELRLASFDRNDLSVEVYPSPDGVTPARTGDIFTALPVAAPADPVTAVDTAVVSTAGPARAISLGPIPRGVAAAPTDPDFKSAAVWSIHLLRNLDLSNNPMLRIKYQGDVARLVLNGRLIDDNFYNGRPMEVGLAQFGPEILTGDLRLEILPLRRDAVLGAAKKIFVADSALPCFGDQTQIAEVQSIDVRPRYVATVGK